MSPLRAAIGSGAGDEPRTAVRRRRRESTGRDDEDVARRSVVVAVRVPCRVSPLGRGVDPTTQAQHVVSGRTVPQTDSADTVYLATASPYSQLFNNFLEKLFYHYYYHFAVLIRTPYKYRIILY